MGRSPTGAVDQPKSDSLLGRDFCHDWLYVGRIKFDFRSLR